MSILVIYFGSPPSFPADEQQAGAVRYQIGEVWVDAVGPPPTQADVDEFLSRPAAKSELDLLRERVAALEAQVAALPGKPGP